jgi:hypothetical protein
MGRALEENNEEVLADEVTRQVKRGLSAEPGIYLAYSFQEKAA